MMCDCFLFVKQKTAYEMRSSDWSSDVCSSDLSIVDQLALIGRPQNLGPHRHDDAASAETRRHLHRRLPGSDDRDRHHGAKLAHAVIEIGRASYRARGCQYVLISVVAVTFNKKSTTLHYPTATPQITLIT